MVISPLFAFLGSTSSAYAYLNTQLLKGLGNLAKQDAAQPAIRREKFPSVTVLIAARNEEDRIAKCLDCLMAQDYPADKLQIIIVNDRSTDGTEAILKAYAARSSRFLIHSLVDSPAGFSPKKYALSQGLEKATGEIIVTTDADCLMSKDWVATLVSEFSGDTGLVLGMTSYYELPGKTGLWAGTQALEFLSYGIVAAALVGLRFPVHGNANNIAYRRKVYDQAASFASHGSIVSGDDDFLIQGIHRLGKWSIRYSVKPEGQVQTEPPLSFRQFWEQRKRWASKCSLYEPKQVAFLACIFSYYALTLICIALAPYHARYGLLGVTSWCIKTGTDYFVMRKGAQVFSKQRLMRFFPATSLLHIPLIIAAVVAGTFGEFTWKGQKVKRKLTRTP